MAREDYEVVIGLEVHAELSTKTKIFCSCSTEFGGMPNTHTCPICMAMPGTLPVLNEKVVEYAVKAGLATHCTISRDSKNDRKNYFYPDLPKAYQISQFDKPLCEHGYIEIETSLIIFKNKIQSIFILHICTEIVGRSRNNYTTVCVISITPVNPTINSFFLRKLPQ